MLYGVIWTTNPFLGRGIYIFYFPMLFFLGMLATFGFIMLFLADLLVMPFYVRMGAGKYMVNVIGKELSYGEKIAKPKGIKA